MQNKITKIKFNTSTDKNDVILASIFFYTEYQKKNLLNLNI